MGVATPNASASVDMPPELAGLTAAQQAEHHRIRDLLAEAQQRLSTLVHKGHVAARGGKLSRVQLADEASIDRSHMYRRADVLKIDLSDFQTVLPRQ
jgi:hypothetical protein